MVSNPNFVSLFWAFLELKHLGPFPLVYSIQNYQDEQKYYHKEMCYDISK